MALSRPFTLSSRSRSSTPALRAAAYMLSSKMSQPVKTRSLSPASGTNSLIFGERPSVRFPRRIGSHLRERADGMRDSLAHGFDARYKRRSDRAHARDHHAQLALGGLDRAIVPGAAVCFACGLHLDGFNLDARRSSLLSWETSSPSPYFGCFLVGTVGCMQTKYVLVSGELFANARA